MLAFWTRGFPCQAGKENLWCPEYAGTPAQGQVFAGLPFAPFAAEKIIQLGATTGVAGLVILVLC